MEPDIFLAAAKPEPLGLIPTLISLSEDTKDWTVLDCRCIGSSLEDGRVVACEQERRYDCHVGDNNPPEFFSYKLEIGWSADTPHAKR